MRVLRDVVIDRADQNELQAVSQVPAIVGEEMTLDVMGAAGTMALKVRVLESRPLVAEGTVRHSVRLAVLNAPKEEEAVESSTASAFGGGAVLEAI